MFTLAEEKIKQAETASIASLILYNDDVNTFDYVIELLVEYCGHDTLQAEQCAYLVHYKQQCVVKVGKKEVLLPICGILSDKGLTVDIKF